MAPGRSAEVVQLGHRGMTAETSLAAIFSRAPFVAFTTALA